MSTSTPRFYSVFGLGAVLGSYKIAASNPTEPNSRAICENFHIHHWLGRGDYSFSAEQRVNTTQLQKENLKQLFFKIDNLLRRETQGDTGENEMIPFLILEVKSDDKTFTERKMREADSYLKDVATAFIAEYKLDSLYGGVWSGTEVKYFSFSPTAEPKAISGWRDCKTREEDIVSLFQTMRAKPPQRLSATTSALSSQNTVARTAAGIQVHGTVQQSRRPPQQPSVYDPQQTPRPPQQSSSYYHPQQTLRPPQQSSYPQQSSSYPEQSSYLPPESSYPPQQLSDLQQSSYISQQSSYTSQQSSYLQQSPRPPQGSSYAPQSSYPPEAPYPQQTQSMEYTTSLPSFQTPDYTQPSSYQPIPYGAQGAFAAPSQTPAPASYYSNPIFPRSQGPTGQTPGATTGSRNQWDGFVHVVGQRDLREGLIFQVKMGWKQFGDYRKGQKDGRSVLYSMKHRVWLFEDEVTTGRRRL